MGRSPCCKPNQGLNKGAYWTAVEDQILKEYIKNNGAGRWNKIPGLTGLKRGGKSCRLRWMNYLRPDIKRGNISPDEEDLIIRLHKLVGNRWSLIAGRLPGRTDNEIKNYWNTILGKRVQANCEDPIKEPSNVGSKNLIEQVLEENIKEAEWGFNDDSSWDLMVDINERQIISLSEIFPNDDLDKLCDINASY